MSPSLGLGADNGTVALEHADLLAVDFLEANAVALARFRIDQHDIRLVDRHGLVDDAADDAHYEEALPDASLYTQPAGERNETGGEEGEVRTAGDVPDAEGNGNLPRNAEEEFYEEGEGRAAESEILYIEEPSEKSGTPRKAADDEEIVADDGNAKNQTSTKANKEEIVIEDSPANAKAKTSTKTDNEEIVIEDSPTNTNAKTSKKTDDDEEIVIEDTPANAKAKTSTKTDDDEIVIEDTP